MKALTLTQQQFETLISYRLPDDVINVESTFYIVDSPTQIEKGRKLFKKLYQIEGDYFGNKLLTVNTLMDNERIIGIDQLVMPERIVIVDDTVMGFLLPFIENSINLSTLLKSQQIPNEVKKQYLIAVGKLLKKVQSIKRFKHNFFLSDVHEDNFIIDTDSKMLYAVDLDSCKIGDNQPFPSKYLSTNINLKDPDMNPELATKYPINEDGMRIPNANTEWLCYILLILGYISQGPIYRLKVNEYQKYLDYLHDLSFPYALLDCFERIYTPQNNYSPMHLIGQIPDDNEKASFDTFIKRIKKR